MRENRTYGSEGGERLALPYPYQRDHRCSGERCPTLRWEVCLKYWRLLSNQG